LGLFLAVGLIVSAWILSGSLEKIRSRDDEITVKGFAEKRIVSDQAVWNAWFTTRASQLQAAYADLDGDRSRIETFLREQGVPDAAVAISAVRTSPQYAIGPNGNPTNEVVGYQLNMDVTITSSDVDLVTRVARASGDLVRQGVELSGGSPQYFFTGLDTLKIEMLGEAAADAHERARVLVESGGAKLGALRSASQGVFQITPAFSTEVSPYGMNDTSSLEKSIKAVVTVSYAIER
jgi:hypothetical protein